MNGGKSSGESDGGLKRVVGVAGGRSIQIGPLLAVGEANRRVVVTVFQTLSFSSLCRRRPRLLPQDSAVSMLVVLCAFGIAIGHPMEWRQSDFVRLVTNCMKIMRLSIRSITATISSKFADRSLRRTPT